MVGVPSVERAETLLAEAGARNPGPWVAHSTNVARAAQLIAQQHPGLDAKYAFVFGLLHDIGRREGVTGMRHALDGYSYLQDLGFERAARICLTHSFPYQDSRTSSDWDMVSEQDLNFVRRYIAEIEYDDYDKLLQLCDGIAVAEL